MAYTSSNSVLRAKRLQSFCQEQGLSSLVFILGIDSRRNRLDELLYFWLFKGTSGEANLSSVSLPLNNEEIAWIVTPSTFHIFIGSACNNPKDTLSIYQETLEISCSWPGVTITTVNKEEIIDSELAENTKVLWFNRTMSKIPGPCGVCSSVIEIWPLIQAYAIDIFGLGFFSMSHPPSDISLILYPVFLEFDDAGILSIINDDLPRLNGVFTQTIEFVNKRNYTAGRGELTESLINECMTLPFEYATIQSKKQHPIVPFVKLFTYDNSIKVHSAHHMTCVSVCGTTGMICGRTWFFIQSGSIKEFIANEQDDDLHGMIHIYKIIIKAVRLGISDFRSENEMKDRILFELFKDRGLIKYHHMLEAVRKAEVTFASYDADGNTLPFTPELPLHSVYFKASDIGSKDFGNLGDLVFAESFVYKRDRVTLLTCQVEDFVIWENQTKKPWQSPYGEKLSSIENAELYIESIGVYNGTLLIYESGWAFRSIHLGQLEFNLDEFFKVEQHSSNSISFFTETCQIVIKVSEKSSIVLASVWKIDHTDTLAPEIPVKQKIDIQLTPYLNLNTDTQSKETIPIYFIIGVGGSGKTKSAKDIARGLKIDFFAPDIEHNAYYDHDYWQKVFEKINRSTIIVLPSYNVPYYFIDLIPDNLQLKGIICKVYAKNVYLSKRKDFIPGFIHQIQSCNSLIFEETENSEDIFKLCRLINSNAAVFRISGTIGPSQARNIVHVDKPMPIQLPYKPIVSLQSVFVRIPLALLESKIKQRLANSENFDDGTLAKRINWNNEMEILRVKGLVEFYNKEQSFFEISGNAKYMQSLLSEPDVAGILFIGRNFDILKLYDFILDCRSHVNKVPLKNRKMLTESEIELVESNLGENSEYEFDGQYYVDSMGKRYKKHPDLEKGLLDYINSENDRIGSINRSIEKEVTLLKKANMSTAVNLVFDY